MDNVEKKAQHSAGTATAPAPVGPQGAVLRVVLTDGAIRNGYLQFPLQRSIFPTTTHGDPSGSVRGRAIHVVDDAGNSYSDDIRVVGNTARLRARFGSFFRTAKATANDVAELSETGPGEYFLCIRPGGQEGPVEHPCTETGALDEAPPQSGNYSMQATNTIFYGPPGTGKTHSTTGHAVWLCDGEFPEGGQGGLRNRFDELRRSGRISFVTFHQSYGYEEFVQGLRPEVTKTGQVVYSVRPGAFLKACDDASRRRMVTPGLTGKPLKDRRIFKMSLGAAATPEGAAVYDYCLKNQCVLLGWGKDIDFTGCDDKSAIEKKIAQDEPGIEKAESQAWFVDYFKHEMKVGDLILISQGNKLFRAVAEVAGEYEFAEDAPFQQMRAVKWLAIIDGGMPAAEVYKKEVGMSTLYKLNPAEIAYDHLDTILAAQGGAASVQPHVIIIDEINRANISKVLGELITLIEPDKREGAANAITVKLPYSGEDFSVPANLHIVGTMNTADRSIALLDTALRRRFDFVEVMPDPGVLKDLKPGGVDLAKLLTSLNQRIEVLYDRDHTIGHAYFMQVKSLDDLEQVFRRKVLPLLQEYFFENWSKVRRVLNDLGDGDFVRKTTCQAISTDGDDELSDEVSVVYSVNRSQFPAQAYLRIYDGE